MAVSENRQPAAAPEIGVEPLDTPAHWRDGWWAQAERLPSPNVGPRRSGTVIDLIVVHCISLPPGEFGGPYVADLFSNRLDPKTHPFFATIEHLRVSAHFVIQRDGHLQQFVSGDERAWHAGASDYRGRGPCNDSSIGIELEGTDSSAFTPAQYEALERLCLALKARYPIAHITGHEHIAPGRKTDPGVGFDWYALRCRLGWTDVAWPVL